MKCERCGQWMDTLFIVPADIYLPNGSGSRDDVLVCSPCQKIITRCGADLDIKNPQ